MDTLDLPQAVYLGLLLVAVVGWTIAANRGGLGRFVQHAAIWAFIFLGTIAAFGLWNDIRNEVAPRAAVMGGRIEIPRGLDGHYHLTLRVDGTPVDFVIDTGATDLVLSMADAQRIGIDTGALAFTGQAATANGAVRTANVRLASVEIGPITDRNVPASVTQGAMSGSLLGMTYLQRFARIEIAGNRMILER